MSSFSLHYDETTLPKIAKEIYEGTIHETTLKLFELWLHEDDDNLELAKQYIRELKLPEDYPTSRIKNVHLRALLDATRDIRATYRAASPSPTKKKPMTLAEALNADISSTERMRIVESLNADTSPTKKEKPMTLVEALNADISPIKRDDRMTLADALKSDMIHVPYYSPSRPRQHHRPSPLQTPISRAGGTTDTTTTTAASPVVRTPTSSKLQPRSPFSMISPTLRTLRTKAASARKETKLSIGQLPRHEYPPDVPERPLPLGSPGMLQRSEEDPFMDDNGGGGGGQVIEDSDDADTIVAPSTTTTTRSSTKGGDTPGSFTRSGRGVDGDDATLLSSASLPLRSPAHDSTRRRRAPLPAFRFPDGRPTTVDMASLAPFEASWRRMNRRLLVAAFGREDCVLGVEEIEFIEDMAMVERRG
ncbi:hypothetical protein DM02DRAFT_678992 [Periconia macrospinosa]|uniref:Uncharacterized protein n=1 Tax=Periconia macrospinosa TaxID=97972 RepID=A0A2V1EGD7_9PLEO|nr:hypothetical protein DM02DRAFT_678992 [Periconia macrospinosa]